MASHTSQKADDPETNTTRSESDTDTKKYLKINFCGKHFDVSLPSNLTKQQAVIVLVSTFLCAVVYLQNIAWAFLAVLGAIIIAVLIEALDFVRRKLSTKSKEEKGRDSEKQTRDSIKDDTKNVPIAEETNLKHGNEKQTDEDDVGAGSMRTTSTGTLTTHRGAKVDEKRYSNIGVQKYFYFIMESVSSAWMDLAFHLDFHSSEIDNIKGRNSDEKSRCMDMLQEWKKKTGTTATIEVLMEALFEADLFSVVDGLKTKFPETQEVDLTKPETLD